jgi:hypothetical protein
MKLQKLIKGDTVRCTGDSGFCTPSYEKITHTTYKYDVNTGKQYKIIWLTGGRAFDSRTGNAIYPPLAYYIKPIQSDKLKGGKLDNRKSYLPKQKSALPFSDLPNLTEGLCMHKPKEEYFSKPCLPPGSPQHPKKRSAKSLPRPPESKFN